MKKLTPLRKLFKSKKSRSEEKHHNEHSPNQSNPFKDRIQNEMHKGKEILIANLSDLNVANMISMATRVKDIIRQENKPMRLLVIFNKKNYATPKFIRHAEQLNKEWEHLVEKQAVIGLNKVKLFILKGFNLALKKKISAFETLEEAKEFLVSEEP